MEISVVQGDITKIAVDVIVNAANTSLMGGSGVDGAIHKAGGPEILEECRKIRARQGGCKTGEVVITTGGKLPCKYVIHTVGPVWLESKADELEKVLTNCYQKSMELALEKNATSIAFPNISTGIYKFPKELAAEIAISTVRKFAEMHEVIFVCYDSENFNLYKQKLS